MSSDATLESAPAGPRLHAIGDEGVSTGDLAAVIGRHLGLPVSAIASDDINAHFGWIGAFWAMDIPATSALTRQHFCWQPTEPGLLDDLEHADYFDAT